MISQILCVDAAIADLTEIIDTTHCGYCKMIIGDAREILTQYEGLMDKAAKMDEISQQQKAFLSETNSKANEMISQYTGQPVPVTSNTGGSRMGSRLQKVQNRPMVKMIFGDMFGFFQS